MTNWEHYGDGQNGRDKYAELGYLSWSEWGNSRYWEDDNWITNRVPNSSRVVEVRLRTGITYGIWSSGDLCWTTSAPVYGWREPTIINVCDEPNWEKLPTETQPITK